MTTDQKSSADDVDADGVRLHHSDGSPVEYDDEGFCKRCLSEGLCDVHEDAPESRIVRW